jgi:hypothetical protein
MSDQHKISFLTSSIAPKQIQDSRCLRRMLKTKGSYLASDEEESEDYLTRVTHHRLAGGYGSHTLMWRQTLNSDSEKEEPSHDAVTLLPLLVAEPGRRLVRDRRKPIDGIGFSQSDSVALLLERTGSFFYLFIQPNGQDTCTNKRFGGMTCNQGKVQRYCGLVWKWLGGQPGLPDGLLNLLIFIFMDSLHVFWGFIGG